MFGTDRRFEVVEVERRKYTIEFNMREIKSTRNNVAHENLFILIAAVARF